MDGVFGGKGHGEASGAIHGATRCKAKRVAASQASFKLPRFWRIFAKHYAGCDADVLTSASASRDPRTFESCLFKSGTLEPGSAGALVRYQRHPSTFLFRSLEAQEASIHLPLAQRICVGGILRFYFALQGRLAPPRRTCLAESADFHSGEVIFTQDLLERRFREVCPKESWEAFDEFFPPLMRYYVGVTSVMDYGFWKASPRCGRQRHHRRCGLTRTPLDCVAIIDSLVQTPADELAEFLNDLLETHGEIELLAARPRATEMLRQALCLAASRLPSGSREWRSVESILSERCVARQWSRVAEFWNANALPWYLAKDLLHDFAPEAVSLKTD